MSCVYDATEKVGVMSYNSGCDISGEVVMQRYRGCDVMPEVDVTT